MARAKVPAKRNLPKRNSSAGKRRKVIRGIDETHAPEAVGSRETSSHKAPEIPIRLDQRFKSANYRDLYNLRFGTRKIAPGRIVDFKSFDSSRAAFVRKWFQTQNLVKLMEDQEPIYPDLVRQFYTHFDKANGQVGVIHTWVKGEVIVLDEKTLGQIFGIPTAGVHDSTGKKWSTHEVFDMDRCIKRVLMDKEAERDKKPLTEELPMPTRLLHLILMYTFLSREGRKSSLTYLDLFVMYCILTKENVNLPRMIIDWMVAANKNKSGGVIPYSMWLTKVFNWFRVDLKNEPVTKNTKRTLSSTTITGDIGYSFDDETGLWIKRGIKCAPKKGLFHLHQRRGRGRWSIMMKREAKMRGMAAVYVLLRRSQCWRASLCRKCYGLYIQMHSHSTQWRPSVKQQRQNWLSI